MESQNILDITSREEFRHWLELKHSLAKECWIEVKRGSTPSSGKLWYLDSVEEALCFGWIDSVNKRISGVAMQRFSPRRKRGGTWSELNKERCRRLEKLGLMTEAGRAVLPDMTDKGFVIDRRIIERFKKNKLAWDNFCRMPQLYQRVRIDTIQRDTSDMKVFFNRLERLVSQSENGKMFGEWNDYGRLIDY